MRLSIILFLIFISVADSFCQNQNSVWYFGDSAGISFASGVPVGLTNGITWSAECSSVISDKAGNLLFYIGPLGIYFNNADTLLIRNNQHQIMPDGNYIKGDGSCTQGSLILPFADDTNKYFVFTLSTDVSYGAGFYYSVIDMTLDSGRGNVVQKNILITNISFSEKLTTVRHGNGRDWWVLTHSISSNSFYKYLVTQDTILFVDSQSIGTVYNSVSLLGFYGQMVFSPSGNKLACAGIGYMIDLFDFDRCTGLISNWVDLGDPHPTPDWAYYGCSFSPSGDRLYVSGFDSLFQYDITAVNIKSSKTLVFFSAPRDLGQHLLSTDNKIYIANNTGDTTRKYIHVIEKPNDLYPACTFNPFGLYLGGGKSRYGLPNMPNYNLGRLIASPCDTVWAGVQNTEQPTVLIYVTYINAWQKLFVNAQGLKGRSFKISVYDLLGNVIYTAEGKLTSQYFTRDLNMAAFAKGMYIVNFVTDKERLAKKFIKD